MTHDKIDIHQFFLSELERSTDTGCWCYDLASNELFWSPQTYRIHGIDEAIKPDVSQAINFYHPDDREKISRAFERCIERGKEFREKLRIIKAILLCRPLSSIAEAIIKPPKNKRTRGCA